MHERLFWNEKTAEGRSDSRDGEFVIVERGSNNIIVEEASNRNLATISDIIKRKIEPGSHIIGDDLRTYESEWRNHTDYLHSNVNHSLNFIDPNDLEIHKQNIEGVWSVTNRNWANEVKSTYNPNLTIHSCLVSKTISKFKGLIQFIILSWSNVFPNLKHSIVITRNKLLLESYLNFYLFHIFYFLHCFQNSL